MSKPDNILTLIAHDGTDDVMDFGAANNDRLRAEAEARALRRVHDKVASHYIPQGCTQQGRHIETIKPRCSVCGGGECKTPTACEQPESDYSTRAIVAECLLGWAERVNWPRWKMAATRTALFGCSACVSIYAIDFLLTQIVRAVP